MVTCDQVLIECADAAVLRTQGSAILWARRRMTLARGLKLVQVVTKIM